MANNIEDSAKKVEEVVKTAQELADSANKDSSSYYNLVNKVNEYIRMGGRPEYQTATEHPKTYAKYYNPADKQLTGFDTFEYYKTADGTYTRDLSKIAGISMDANGKVSVTIPDKWKDDSEVAKYTDNYILKSLSGNYKKDKDIEYPDPYDENKKIKTEEYIELLNQGLKYRVRALDLTTPLKTELLKKFGGTKEKDAVINGMTTDDIITMTLEYGKDDSWLPIPAYMLEAYPEIAKLSSYANGFVKRADFLENFYNIENGSITERNAYGIARTPDLMLQEVEDMTPDEVAKTIAFGRFVSSFDPKRSLFSKFLQDMDAKSRGFYGGLEEKLYEGVDNVISIATLSKLTGTKPDTKSFMEGLFGDSTMSGQLGIAERQMALTNRDALTHAQKGYIEGATAGDLAKNIIEMILIGEAVNKIASTVTSLIIKKGSSKIAAGLASSANSTVDAADTAKLMGEAQTLAAKLQSKSSLYQTFFSQTLSQARTVYENAVKGIGIAFESMNIAQVVQAANSAARVASLAQYANTAVNVVGSLTLAAIVGNKELTTKVLTNRATNDETQEWILSTLFSAAKYEAYGLAITGLGNVADNSNLVGAFKSSDLGQKVKEVAKYSGEKLSKAMMKVEKGFSTPWLKFRKWFMNNQMAANYIKKAASNSKVAAEGAIKEAVLVNEARAYGANMSIVPGSTGTTVLGESLASSGSVRGQFDAEVLNWLSERGGIAFDAATNSLSEFQGWKADYAEMQNAMNNWGDISQNISQAVGEFTNPDIYPTISQNLSELKNANSALLKEETKAGLLTGKEVSANKSILSADTSGYIYAMHSPELSRYLVRNYEASILKNEAKTKGVNPEKYEPYQNAVARLHAAAESVPERLRRIADDKYIPALKRAEHEIVDVMISDGVYPKAFVDAMRQSGKYGKNGEDWMRLVAKQELPKGVYNPYSGTTKRDNTIALGSFKVLSDEDITWPGNGLQELIQEYGIARAEKRFLEASKKATGLTTDVVVSGKETAGAGKMQEFRSNLAGAVRQGFNSFTEDVEGTMAIGKKRAIERRKFYDEIAVTGGIGSMDIDVLRGVMKDNGLPMAEDIVDQPTLDKVYKKSSAQGKKIISDTIGDKLETQGSDAEGVGAELAKLKNYQYDKLADLRENDTNAYELFLERLDRANASASSKVKKSDEAKASAELYKQDIEDLEKSTIFNEEFSYLAQPEAKKGTNALKYDLDKDTLYTDIDDAIDGLIGVVTHDAGAMVAVEGIANFQGVELSEPRLEFIVLGEILGDEGKDLFGKAIEAASHRIVDGIIGKNKAIVKGNLGALYKKVEGTINDKLETRFAAAKTQLESMGEPAESETITKLLDKYREEIMDAKADPLVVKTTDANGEIQFERVSPTIADIYNNRPVYNPISTPKQILMNLALVKKISTTDLSPRSFMKQSVSDPAMAFATVGVLPGTLSTMRDEIKYTFGQSVLSAIEKNDPIRYSNIQAIAARDNISEAEALMKNLKATADVQVPFTLLNQEILRRANVSKYGNQAAMDMARRGLSEKINGGLRKASDVLGTPQNKREAYFRILAGEKAYLNALKDGYSQQQAEVFREHAINTATTNFRLKITIFNNLRSTVPYLTSGISGFRSFWKMFELDPVGVTSRIFTGFILPIIFFMGEIVSNKELREKYATLAESEKSNHIVVPVGGDFILIPIGEELGNYVNMATHVVETLYGSNKYDFWNLMLNDFVGLAPLDLTGFVDPDLLSQNPDLGEIIESGIGRVIAQTTPPIVQTAYIINTGKDPYTGKDLTNDYYSVDEDGNLVRMTQTSSQFAKALATMVGGDARVIEKIASGLMGPTFLHTLDAITSAVDFAGSGGQSGSLTTAIDKFMEDATKPFTAVGYDSMDRRFSSEVNRLFRKKEAIESSDEYKKYNTEISKEKDSNRRRTLINKRNDLITEYKNRVEEMVKRYRDAGLMLDKSRFSKVVSLIVFEDALRADRQYMDLNTNYSDAYKQAMQTLYEMGIENPEGPSTLGYIYTDSNGKPQLKMYTPTQTQIVQNAFYGQREIHRAQIEGIFNDGTANSLKNKRDQETKAEQKYWDKYNATGKLSSDEWDAIDDLRKAYNAEVVLALQDYMDTYGAENVLSSEDVMNYLVDNVIKVPSSEEKVNGRYVSSGGGKLDKQEGFGPYYIKKIFGVVK